MEYISIVAVWFFLNFVQFFLMNWPNDMQLMIACERRQNRLRNSSHNFIITIQTLYKKLILMIKICTAICLQCVKKCYKISNDKQIVNKSGFVWHIQTE